MTDGQLLELYAAKRDGDAFAAIVRRHGGMVHATARRLARDEAEDVTQAVFLLLAQKAPKLSRYRNLAGWLHNVTRYCAANARRSRGRREKHLENYQQQEAAMRHSSASNDPDNAANQFLDAALARLKDDQRQAVLLRYVEGLSLDEAAARLGVNAAAVAKRAERGVTRLREYFGARGVTLSDAALAATPIPAAMLSSLSQTATGVAPAEAAASIASATGTTMTLATLKSAALVLIALAGVTAAAVGIAKVTRPSPTAAQASSRPATTGAAAAAPLRPTSAPAGLTQETGKAVAQQFIRGLQERDEEAVAALVIADSPDEARAAAAGFIAQIRDGLYAQFPQRLEQITGSMFSSSQQGEMQSAVLTTHTPTDADIVRLSIRLEPRGGAWRVRDAKVGDSTAMLETSHKAPLATMPADPKVPAGTYAKAAELSRSFQSRLNYPAEEAELDKERAAAAANMKLAQADLRQLAVVLRPTDLAIPDETVAQLNKWIEQSRVVLQVEGAAAYLKLGESIEKDPAFMAAAQRVWGIDETLGRRAEAESAQLQHGTRPPSFAAPIELKLAWDSTRVTVPGPVTMPSWFRESPTFKSWQKRHDIQTFRTRDDAGNTYEIHCLGGVKEADGKTYDMITNISMFRPDGTRAASADYNTFGHATEWVTLDRTGKVLVSEVITQNGRRDDRSAPPVISQVKFFDEKKNQRVWEVGKDNIVTSEILKDPVATPIKTLHARPNPPLARATSRAATSLPRSR